MSAAEVVRELRPPAEWRTSDVLVFDVYGHRDAPSGRGPMVVGGGLLQDDTNLWMVSFPGGTRWLRSAASTGYALEERYRGRKPDHRDAAAVDAMWSHLVEVAADSGRATRALADVPRTEQLTHARSTALLLAREVAGSVADDLLKDPTSGEVQRARLVAVATRAGQAGVRITELCDAIREGHTRDSRGAELLAAFADHLLALHNESEPDAPAPSEESGDGD